VAGTADEFINKALAMPPHIAIQCGVLISPSMNAAANSIRVSPARRMPESHYLLIRPDLCHQTKWTSPDVQDRQTDHFLLTRQNSTRQT